jgi:hypothetical protein
MLPDNPAGTRPDPHPAAAPGVQSQRSIPRLQLAWFLAGLLPAVVWAFAVWLSQPAGFAIFSTPFAARPVSFHLLMAALALWWMSLCAWRHHRLSRGFNLPHEIQRFWQWLGLLLMVNLPLAAVLWLLAQLLR